MSESKTDTGVLLRRLQDGDQQSLAELYSRYRERLRHLVNLRLDQRLAGRIDSDDVLQEIYLDAADRIDHFINEHSGSFFVWLRLVATQTLANVHRRHLGAQMRDAKREFSIYGGHYHQATSTSLALQLLGDLTSPSQAAMREETARKLEEAIDNMSQIDQEVLKLRHFEQLTNTEVAEVLGIQKKAASIRYIRALKRLKDVWATIPGMSDDSSESTQ